jgi:hypothetical protein
LIILISPFPPPMTFNNNLKTINEVLPDGNSRALGLCHQGKSPHRVK